MLAVNNDNPTTVDGLRAVELRYRAIRDITTKDPVYYQTQMRLNSPSLGVLMPDRYLPVLDCTDQCVSVFKLAFVQMLQAMNKFTERNVEFDWISIYMPVRFLGKKDCVQAVTDICKDLNVRNDKVCFEVSCTILENKEKRAAENIRQLRKNGFHFMLDEFGGDMSPIMRIADYNFDYIMLDRGVTKMLDKSEQADACVKSLVAFVNNAGAEPIAAHVTMDSQTVKLFEYECSYYTGALAGNYVLERFIRRKNDF